MSRQKKKEKPMRVFKKETPGTTILFYLGLVFYGTVIGQRLYELRNERQEHKEALKAFPSTVQVESPADDQLVEFRQFASDWIDSGAFVSWSHTKQLYIDQLAFSENKRLYPDEYNAISVYCQSMIDEGARVAENLLTALKSQEAPEGVDEETRQRLIEAAWVSVHG